MNNSEFQARAEEVERLVQRVSALENPEARTAALDLLQSTMDLHGSALSRIVEMLSESGEAGQRMMEKLGSDPLICGLLVLYEIHPVSLEDRVARALDQLGPQLSKQNAAAELVSLDQNLVRIRLKAEGHGCGSSSEALRAAVQQAVLEVAPEAAEIVVENLPSSASGFVPLDMIQTANKKEGTYEESTA